MPQARKLPAPRGRPAKITREKLVETASELGLADVKLTEVARRLNVTLQTLYNHVRDRDELLRFAADLLEKGLQPLDPTGLGWVEWWHGWASFIRGYYKDHPGLAGILMARKLANAPPISETPPVPNHWEVAQILAEREGLPPRDALWANMALNEFVYSWVAREDRQGGEDPGRRSATPSKAVAEHLPHVARATAIAAAHDVEDRFAMTFDALMHGLLARRDESGVE